MRLSFLILAITFAACTRMAPRSESLSPAKPRSIAVRLARSGCYGSCPVYVVNVGADGKGEFNGVYHTKTIGKAEFSLPPEKMTQLIDEIDKASFFDFRDSYVSEADGCPTKWTDHPVVKLYVKLDNRERTIVHDLGCKKDVDPADQNVISYYPKGLYELENKIDEIVGIKRWIGER